jgi:glycosyl transferase family 87
MDRSARPEAPSWWGFGQALLVASFLVMVGLGLLRGDQELKNSDWPSFMVAGRLVATQPHQLYDREAELREQRLVVGLGAYDLAGYGGLLPVVAPPWVALYAVPFAALGLGAGGRIWILAQVLALVAGLLLVSGGRELVRALAAVAGVPLVLLVGNAQLDGILVLGLGLAWRLYSNGRLVWAGAALGLTLVKPHLVLGVAAGLIAARCWRVLLGWSLAALALLAATLVLAPGTLGAWPAAALATAGHNGNDLSLPGLLYAAGVTPQPALLVGALTALGVTLVIASRAPDRAAAAAVLVLGGLLAAPHLLATDLVIACFALVLAGMAAVVPLLLLSIGSLVLAVRIPAAAAACGGCLLIAGLLAGVAGIAGRPWALGIIGREFGSR